MQINHEIFLLVAEEQSISRVAQRKFLTQQCVSDHIKRLEGQFAVQLFTRKPRFQLTQHGHELVAYLRKIRQIEENMYQKMDMRAHGERGSFTMGISSSRSQIVLPWILPEYYARFPEVKINRNSRPIFLPHKLLISTC
jgi:DNA-binding transcriptional LysR family regulator